MPHPIAYFVGVHPGSRSGHYDYAPGFATLHRFALPRSPWASPSGPLAEFVSIPDARAAFGMRPGHAPDREHEREGVPLLLHRDGWTLLGMWDRSADSRFGSCSCFAFQQHLDLAGAVSLARELFPGVIERIERHIGRALV